MKRLNFAIPFTVLALSATLSAQTLDEVLAKNFEARGGLEKIKAVQSFKATGTISLQGGAMQGAITMWQKRPKMVRMEMDISGMKIVQAYDGEKAWHIMPPMAGGSGTPEEASGSQAQEMIEQADMDGFLVGYKEKGHQVELVGKEDVEGTEAFHLKITLSTGQVIHDYIDTENYIEIKMTSSREMPGRGEAVVDTYLGDYKLVDGLMLAHSFSSKVEGQTIVEVVIDSIEQNVEVDVSAFSMNQ